MEMIIISVACNVGYMSIKALIENKDLIKEFLHHHNMEKVEIIEDKKDKEIIDDVIPPLNNTPTNEKEEEEDDNDDFESTDVYNLSEKSSNDDEEIRKSVAESILESKPITILQRKSYIGFNPSSLIDKLRSITPSRLRHKVVEPVIDKVIEEVNKEILNVEFEKFIFKIVKFIILEIKAQNIEHSELQTYETYTHKLLHVLNDQIQPETVIKKKIKK
jgi:hypothetical protein